MADLVLLAVLIAAPFVVGFVYLPVTEGEP